MRTSGNSHRSVHARRGLWVKVNLPIFKDEKRKDSVTYCSWWLDMAIFHWSDWDCQHLLPYIYLLIARVSGQHGLELDKDATLSDILQMFDKDCGVVMMFEALGKEIYSLKQGFGENVAEFGVHLSQ